MKVINNTTIELTGEEKYKLIRFLEDTPPAEDAELEKFINNLYDELENRI